MTTASTPAAEPWQIRLFRRSLKKRETMKALLDHLTWWAGALKAARAARENQWQVLLG